MNLPHSTDAGLAVTVTRAEIEHWLVRKIAAAAGIPATSVEVAKQFEYYGLDSMQAMQISADLEAWMSKPLSPTIVWDYPTVELLADHLTAGTQESGR